MSGGKHVKRPSHSSKQIQSPQSRIPKPPSPVSLPSSLSILYEDETCIVVNKPAGLAVHGGEGVGISLDSILAAVYPDLRPLLVHRLDRDTSGIVLVAKGREAAAAFSRLWAAGAVKTYLAVCRGRPESPAGTIRLDLEVRGAARKSETRYRLDGELYGGDFSLLELELGTGRMHQIRRHLAMTGNPVLGDERHGDFALNRSLRKTHGLRRLLLHSARLVIPKMPDGSRLEVEVGPPEHFAAFVEGGRG